MKPIRVIYILFCFTQISFNAFTQSQADCEEIHIESKISAPHLGKSDGKIQLSIENDTNKRFKVFLLNQGAEQASRELKERIVENAKSGQYEFIIIDTKRKKCFKEYQVRVNEVQ